MSNNNVKTHGTGMISPLDRYAKKSFGRRLKEDINANWVLYLIFLPVFLYLLIFNYIPMGGIAIAFENFKVTKGVFGSEWVGFQNFIELFTGETFLKVIRNTSFMALLNLTIGYLSPVVFALLLSEVKVKPFKRTIQTISYAPHFIAIVVVARLATEFLNTDGAVTNLLTMLGLERQNWLANPNVPVFWLINTFTDMWQGFGYGAIVFVAAISNITPEIYEAAAIDGANRWQRMLRITLPAIMPVVITMFTLRVGLVFVTGFNKILLMYKPIIYDTADCIQTYTYRMAFGSQINYSLSAASGLFQSIVATILLFVSNAMNKAVAKTSLF